MDQARRPGRSLIILTAAEIFTPPTTNINIMPGTMKFLNGVNCNTSGGSCNADPPGYKISSSPQTPAVTPTNPVNMINVAFIMLLFRETR